MMPSSADRRKKKKSDKKRQKDKQRQQVARTRRRASKVRNVSRLSKLPMADCFASECWHDHGPPSVWAAFSRRHPNGNLAASLFHLDLRDGGVLQAESMPSLQPGQLESELGKRAGEQVVSSCEPAVVAGLIDAAKAMSAEQGRPLPARFQDAVELLGDVDGSDCPYEILTGLPPEPDTARKTGKGLLERMKGWVGR
jgi:hypothetical protein